jgi:2-polyprenyl-3-methyl-5-hydroxy-6-metoxy-1,4-benzoquinol methylase
LLASTINIVSSGLPFAVAAEATQKYLETRRGTKMAQNGEDNLQVQRAWNTNAKFWDDRMAEGNDFFNILIWPAVERLLEPVAGQRLLDAACGNGVTSRRLAHAGASVTAFDFSEAMIELARQRGGSSYINYRVVDATDREALLDLGLAAFDGALCNMALMDLADINPLMNALASLLRPNGRFVFSVLHPCFNNPATIQMGELEDRAGSLVTTYSVKISRYLTPYTQAGLAHGRPASAASLLSPASQCAAGSGICSRTGAGCSGRMRFPSGKYRRQ